MKKRLISLLLALVMIVTLCPMSVFADDDAAATDNGEETVVVTQEPESEPEPAEEPAEKEPAEEPSEEPAGEEPSEEPAGEEPSEEPAGEEPSEEPAGEEPSEEPEGEDPVNGDDPAEGDDPENGEDPTEGEDPAEDPEEPEPEEPAEEADPSDEGTFCGAHAHTHSAACYDENGALICGKEEHTHTLACYSDPNADVEDERDWKKSVSSAVLTGEWAHDLIEVAKTQLGYQESEKNYIVTEDGQKKGYTRYGAWAGKATVYADWCAGFVAFCAYYAKVEIPTSFGCMLFAEKLQGAGLYRSADGYEPKAGDIIFFGEKNGSVPNHTGIVVSVSDTQIRTIEGNHTNKVASFTYDRND
ncbi:MAG: CHAP domain-containing protein, partial [Clostridia bacterium]|nr:CHAP domain-containing protein [Clostridia bacterium]